MMKNTTFDTLAYANKLKAAGVESVMAEAQAAANAELFSGLIDDKLLTQHNFNEFKISNKQDIDSLKHDIDSLKHDVEILKYDVNELKNNFKELREEVHEFKLLTEHNFNEMRLSIKHDLIDLENRMTIRFGRMWMAGVGLLATLMTVFHLIH